MEEELGMNPAYGEGDFAGLHLLHPQGPSIQVQSIFSQIIVSIPSNYRNHIYIRLLLTTCAKSVGPHYYQIPKDGH